MDCSAEWECVQDVSRILASTRLHATRLHCSLSVGIGALGVAFYHNDERHAFSHASDSRIQPEAQMGKTVAVDTVLPEIRESERATVTALLIFDEL